MSFPSIHGFEITAALGEGGMGSVYLARQLSLNRRVAIKVLPSYFADDDSYVMRFHQEASAAADLKHSGIVQIYDAGESGGVCYFVMEYVDGETTGCRVRRKGRLDETSALLIGEAVAVALEYAWSEKQLVHRDLKPDNILIDSDGTVKVVDLGLAKLLTRSPPSITVSRAIIGSPHYCAPEQARGELDVDHRSDIYSLGATLYHFITGSPPFSETSGVAAMVRNITDYVSDPMECCPDVSEPAAWLIEKMMAKDRRHRHQSWADVLHDIELVMAGQFPALPKVPSGGSTIKRGKLRMGGKRAAGARRDTASLGFRIFLAIAAAFTIALCIAWFRSEYKQRTDAAEQLVR